MFSQLVNNHFNSNHLSLLRIEKWEKVFYAFTSELSMFSFIILFMGICLLPSIIFLQRIKNKLSLVLIFTFLFSTVNTITVILFQYYLDFFSRRYLLASITIPFIFFCIVILLRRPKIILGLCLILLSIILFLVIDKSEGIFSRLTNFQPKSSQCVDSFFEKFHYNKGASDYWIARPTAIFSKNKIFIYPVETDFGIGLWNTNLQEYKPKNFTAPQFFIFRGKQQVNFLEKFGNPSNIFNCSPYEFWIYDSTHPSMIKYTEDMRRNLLLWEKLTGREF